MAALDFNHLLHSAKKLGASDLHLMAGIPPAFRITGEIILADMDAMTRDELIVLTDCQLNNDQKATFARDWELCFSVSTTVAGRVRCTLYQRNNCPEWSVRICADHVHSRQELGLPAHVDELARKTNGLVLITGPTGSGKTTTLNYMVDLINHERRCKIVTIEDPIEYVHANDRAIIAQLEVLSDTRSFARALVHVLRQDPDVIVIGEMRERDTVATALTAAETGHLVLATVHSPDAVHTLERIIGVYEGEAQRQVICQLANSLQGIISQSLLPSIDRKRRVLAHELLLATTGVRSTIRDNKVEQLANIMQTSSREGMVNMDGCLLDLYSRCLISYDTALTHASDPSRFEKVVT